MAQDIHGVQEALDRLFYIAGALGLFQLGRALIGYLVRYRIKRGEGDDSEFRQSIKRLWKAHDDCPIERVETRLSGVEQEIRYVRGRVDQHINGKGG
ncbi:MAG TPA: hypothetical protein PLE60_13630 [Candidatus Latescibacteria bacterium]|nr:hypothetical protein [Spirochaetota bacterium]HPU86363.1 hypothetical protein [Candidatus Latescibacterota bacterium]